MFKSNFHSHRLQRPQPYRYWKKDENTQGGSESYSSNKSFKTFNENNYINEVREVAWSQVLLKEDPDLALGAFDSLLRPIVSKQAPVRKLTVRNAMSPWLDQGLKTHLMERDKAKADLVVNENGVCIVN